MGICASAIKPQNLCIETAAGLYRQVLKCPRDHWLAVYSSEKCTKCHQKSVSNSAAISCVDCDYALCEGCFSKKFAAWQKKASKLNEIQSKQLLQSLHQQIVNFTQLNLNIQQYPRFANFLQQQYLYCLKYTIETKPCFRKSLEKRIQKIARLCQQVYNKKVNQVSI